MLKVKTYIYLKRLYKWFSVNNIILKKKKLITSLDFTAFLSTLKTIKCSSYLTVGHLKCNSHHLFHWIRNCLYCFAYGCKKIVLVQAYIFLWKWYKISNFCFDTHFSWIVAFFPWFFRSCSWSMCRRNQQCRKNPFCG